ncbi:serine palmitoyltransferase 1 [Nilaparvata lugens]|uniref:serine palmitoyltransferase 1 n=1 Tax=Nilaparvata lugens TaxID=108931 RepID=UPI00193D7986|nr:serine palmitoyltransferase 1 [Nilaparvata lugens]
MVEKSFFTSMLTELFIDVPYYHLLLEVALFIWVIFLIFRKSTPSQSEMKRLGLLLKESEKEQLLNDWNPEPLIDNVSKEIQPRVERIVEGKVGKHITVNGQNCLNFATQNYIGFIGNEAIEEKAIQTIFQCGVGSCGPRGFYGTHEIHLELEDKLAKFMDLEEALVYSYGFSAISSAIPAYAKRGDIIFVDEGVNFAVQMGLEASRSEIKYFKHNDVKDLEKLLDEQAGRDLRNPKKAAKTRRFLVVEGIYMKFGDICPLPELIELRKKHKLRIFIDESISFGTLGKHGRGVTEYFNIPKIEVDLIMVSMENSLASVGGFCVGSSYIIEHQRLSGLGYCFSASLPPLLATAAIAAIEHLESDPSILNDLQEKCHHLQKVITGNAKVSEIFTLMAHPDSPAKHLHLKNASDLSLEKQIAILENISNFSINHGYAIVPASYLYEKEKCKPTPSIRLAVNVQMTLEEIDKLCLVLEQACSDYILTNNS